jgi:hypothetical protein
MAGLCPGNNIEHLQSVTTKSWSSYASGTRGQSFVFDAGITFVPIFSTRVATVLSSLSSLGAFVFGAFAAFAAFGTFGAFVILRGTHTIGPPATGSAGGMRSVIPHQRGRLFWNSHYEPPSH